MSVAMVPISFPFISFSCMGQVESTPRTSQMFVFWTCWLFQMGARLFIWFWNGVSQTVNTNRIVILTTVFYSLVVCIVLNIHGPLKHGQLLWWKKIWTAWEKEGTIAILKSIVEINNDAYNKSKFMFQKKHTNYCRFLRFMECFKIEIHD